jgi:hypothetical protein
MRHFVGFVLILLPLWSVRGEQPIFGEMPRWDGGYGVQALQVIRQQNLQVGEQSSSSTRLLHYTRVEGVYTWDKAIRITGKLRILDHGTLDGESQTTWRGPSGLTLALPLKKYFNLDGRSGSFTIAPQFYLPFQRGATAPFARNERVGLSVGYETETYYYHLGASGTTWYEPAGSGQLYGASASAGLNGFMVGFSGHLKAVGDILRQPNGSTQVHVGPTLYGMINDDWHWQLSSRHALSTLQTRANITSDHSLSVGLGWVH